MKYNKIQEVLKEEGSEYVTLNSGTIKIVEWEAHDKILIEFIDSGFRKYVRRDDIERGVVRDNSKSYFGVGNSSRETTIDCNGKMLREYVLWANMIKRCYSNKFHKKWETYKGCSVSDNFKDFKYFAEWCRNQIGFLEAGWQLDKDFIIKGSKEYSENTCVFLPAELNMFVVKNKSRRGDCPIGVCYDKSRGKYSAGFCSNKGTRNNLGRFDTKEEAFQSYKIAKESHAKQLAIKYKGLVDERVIEALKNYTVEITD